MKISWTDPNSSWGVKNSPRGSAVRESCWGEGGVWLSLSTGSMIGFTANDALANELEINSHLFYHPGFEGFPFA